MILAVWSASFCIETLTLQRSIAQRTPEAGGVVVVVDCLHPTIAGCDWEITGHTLRSEQFVPISFTIWQAIFQIERCVREYLFTVGAHETF